MAAVCALASISCAVQGKFKIFPQSRYGEPLNLYILIIANSGERKSPIIRLMTRPIYQYEDKENKRRQELMEADQANLSSWKKQIDTLERDGKTDEAAKLKAKCRELEHNRIKPLRLIADDITSEALTSLLAENKGLMTIISTEGGLFDTLAGRYSNSISIDTLLKAYTLPLSLHASPSRQLPHEWRSLPGCILWLLSVSPFQLHTGAGSAHHRTDIRCPF
ncbi:DUF3987 domain-containing protein [Acidaminobacterium chupaoyuni]